MAQIIAAPLRPPITGRKSVFLAGTTTASASAPDWRQTLATGLQHRPITIFNPLRADWDSTWREEPAFTPWREQVEWELDMQERADLVVVYFGPDTDAPVSLLEFGLAAGRGDCARRVMVMCHSGYKKKGNVGMVCARLGIEVLSEKDDLAKAVDGRLAPEGWEVLE